MAVDRAKAAADFLAWKDNAFAQYVIEECGKRLDSELKSLATSDELADVYRAQGRAAVWGTILRLPDDLVKTLKA